MQEIRKLVVERGAEVGNLGDSDEAKLVIKSTSGNQECIVGLPPLL